MKSLLSIISVIITTLIILIGIYFSVRTQKDFQKYKIIKFFKNKTTLIFSILIFIISISEFFLNKNKTEYNTTINNLTLFELYNKNGLSIDNFIKDYEINATECSGDKDFNKSKAMFNLALENYKEKRYYNSIIFYEKSLAICESMDVIYNLGKAYLDSNNFEMAEKYFRKSVMITKKKNNFLLLGYSYLSLGDLFALKNKSYLAVKNYLNAKEIFIKNKYPHEEAFSILKNGIIYKKSEDFKNAIYYYLKALEKVVDKETKAYINLEIGFSYIKLFNKDKAYNFINQSLIIFSNLNNLKGIAYSFIGLSLYNVIFHGNINKAVFYMQKSYKNFKLLKDLQNQLYTLFVLSTYYSQEGDYKEGQKVNNMIETLCNNNFLKECAQFHKNGI